MSGKDPMLLSNGSDGGLRQQTANPSAYQPPLLGHLLWRHRWTIGLTIGTCLFLTTIYLLCATRVYLAEARLYVEQNGPRVFSDNTATSIPSDSYLYTQAQEVQSIPVLRDALNRSNYRSMKMFANLNGDPVDALRQGSGFKVDVGKKDDIITVSMESAYPKEAATFVQAVVDAYLARLSKHRHVTGQEMVKVLGEEREQLEQKREAGIQALVNFKAANGAVSFRDEKGNTTLERLASLSSALTTAELATLDLSARLSATKAILADPEQISAFVEGQQMKGRDFGDKEYDDLRSDLERYQLALQSNLAVIGPRNIRARGIQSSIDLLKTRISTKEKAIAEAQVAQLAVEQAAAEDREKQIRTSLAAQRETAMALNPKAAEYARLESDVERMQKQSDVLDTRMQEVSVNNLKAGALDVEVIDPAHAEERPVRPKKSLSLAIALLAGLLIGSSIVMVQEWQTKLLRTPEDVSGLLEMPLIGMVPRMLPNLSPSARGQIVHADAMSEVSEAYRAIRTTIAFSAPRGAKTFLLTSPTSGEGKSTCSSNLAIAMAQGGHRTLLIDADLRRPVQDKIFEMDGSVGLSDVLTGAVMLRDAVQSTAVEGLYLLTCGSVPNMPAEMLESTRFAQVMQTLSSAFDRVIIDSPPVVAVTDARILAASADATLLVLRMHRSSRKLCAVTRETLQNVNATVIGAIANEAETGDGYGYYGRGRPQASPREQLFRKLGAAVGFEGRAVNGFAKASVAVNESGLSARSALPSQKPSILLNIDEPQSPADARWGLADKDA